MLWNKHWRRSSSCRLTLKLQQLFASCVGFNSNPASAANWLESGLSRIVQWCTDNNWKFMFLPPQLIPSFIKKDTILEPHRPTYTPLTRHHLLPTTHEPPHSKAGYWTNDWRTNGPYSSHAWSPLFLEDTLFALESGRPFAQKVIRKTDAWNAWKLPILTPLKSFRDSQVDVMLTLIVWFLVTLGNQ